MIKRKKSRDKFFGGKIKRQKGRSKVRATKIDLSLETNFTKFSLRYSDENIREALESNYFRRRRK